MPVLEITQIASLIEADNIKEARTLLSDLLLVIPNHLSATVLQAKLYDSDQHIEEAFEHWKKAANLCPGNLVIEKGLRRAVSRRLFSEGSPPIASTAKPEHEEPPPVAAQQHEVVEYQDLDKLISELESAKIVPDPDVQMISHGELESEIDDVVSETLARIYANQKFFEEAAIVYDKLAVQRPDKAAEFLQKAQELRKKGSAKN